MIAFLMAVEIVVVFKEIDIYKRKKRERAEKRLFIGAESVKSGS